VQLLLYTGKGGVGKTTTAAASAVRAAERGRRTLVASADAAHSLGDVLERRLGPEPVSVAPKLDAVEIDARVEMARHWGRIRDFLVELLTHQGVDGVIAEELALLPGAEELATLLAVEDQVASGAYDLVVVDCAPTDAALRVLTLPDLGTRALHLLLRLARTVSGALVPVARRLTSVPLPESGVFRDVDALLFQRLEALRQRVTSPQTGVRLVVTPERMTIDEARRAWTELSLFEVSCDAVVMNRLLPEAATEEPFFRDWGRLQDERRREVAELFAPLPLLEAPLQQDEVTGLERLARHGRALFGRRAPEKRLCPPSQVRFARDGQGYVAHIPLPGADPEQLDVALVDGELAITSGVRRRALPLPRRVAPLSLVEARLEGASLRVRFAPEEPPD
jgi:arsenite-transporting ATPase